MSNEMLMRRILAKTIIFRTIIFFVSVGIAYIFTNEVLTSGVFAITETIVKMTNYFIYDWVWVKKIGWGIVNGKDTRKRTIAKTIVFRFEASILTIIIAYIFTKELDTSLGITAVEFVVKMTAYYINERVWGKIKWGLLPENAQQLDYVLCSMKPVELP